MAVEDVPVVALGFVLQVSNNLDVGHAHHP
jgi:hypothetical protein